MLNKVTKKKILFDAILVLLLLALSLSAYFLVEANRDAGAVVRVSVNNEVVGEYPLNVDAEYTVNGGTNTVRIEGGMVYMVYAECPDKTCVAKGKIYLAGDDITCLPNKVMVYILEN